MKVETDDKGKVLPLVVPTKEELDEWICKREFTTIRDLLDGYAAIHDTHRRVKDDCIEDTEGLICEAIIQAELEINADIYNLFVCAFKDFARAKGGAK